MDIGASIVVRHFLGIVRVRVSGVIRDMICLGVLVYLGIGGDFIENFGIFDWITRRFIEALSL